MAKKTMTMEELKQIMAEHQLLVDSAALTMQKIKNLERQRRYRAKQKEKKHVRTKK